MSNSSRSFAIGMAALGVAAFLAVLLEQKAMGKHEEPEFRVVLSRNQFEVREYRSRVVAQVELVGSRKKALERGFRVLAAYIFGKNQPKQKLEMTSPVTQSVNVADSSIERGSGSKVEMTSPVAAQYSSGRWIIRFFMPSRLRIEELPAPVDARVKLVALPSERMAVSRFSGFWSRSNFDSHRKKLLSSLSQEGIATVGEPLDAYYNPPWTLPFLRRNEVMIAVALRDD